LTQKKNKNLKQTSRRIWSNGERTIKLGRRNTMSMTMMAREKARSKMMMMIKSQ